MKAPPAPMEPMCARSTCAAGRRSGCSLTHACRPRRSPLGEALAAHDTTLEREPLCFAMFGADAWLVGRALEHARLPAQNLWVRYSAFRAGGAPFDLYEVFLPGMGGHA
ncbi:MAG: hypothetical protein NTV91_09455 [Proteobacteria bacterium]|nr:hypothetical protein [Pseudomonadota bacterium]